MLALSMLLEMFVVSNAINPNQMNIYNDIRKAKENRVNSSLKTLTKHVFCPKCNIQVRAANLEKHLAKHEVNPLMMPKIPHPAQPVRSPRKMKPPVIEIKKNAVKSSAVLRNNAEKSVSGWAEKINRTGAELRALYEGKQLPKHEAEIRKAKFKATQDISCLVCKTPLKSSNLNKHYKKVHGIDIQIQELEISGVGELNQEGFISHWSLPGTGKQAPESSCERVRGGKFEEIEEHFFEHWLRLFSEKGYTVAMVQAFRRTSESKHISKSEIECFLEVVKPIKKKPQIQETTVFGKELSESVELIKELHKLAEKVAMSPRNFTRVFTRETGASPARYVAEARLAAARQRLEQTHETLDRIAEQTGFGSSINLRRLFEKQLNLTPGEYRQRFHCRKMA